jgi:hypothetical protein
LSSQRWETDLDPDRVVEIIDLIHKKYAATDPTYRGKATKLSACVTTGNTEKSQFSKLNGRVAKQKCTH